MFKQAWTSVSTTFAVGSILASPLALAQTTPVWTIQPAAQARIVIDPNTTIRPQVPRTLYSFNMRYNQFDKELWDKNAGKVKQPITDALLPMPNIFYRYPGGILANHFEWEKAALSLADRQAARKTGGTLDAYPNFGPSEYLGWMQSVQGTAWWTLNLLGRGDVRYPIELPSATMAESNKKLAQFLKTNYPQQARWFYQLGNELDRNRYEWSHAKYISRSRDSINAILSVDPNAKFVAFMREFDLRYKHTTTGSSTAQSFFNDVMTGLPMINDFSLHFYYDGKLSPTSRYIGVPDMLEKTQKALEMAKAARPGNYNVWITEHSKRLYLSGGVSPSPNALDSGISVADFLLGVTQIPEVKGAGLQALPGSPRTSFFKDTLSGTPAFWALRVLASQPYLRVLASRTSSPNRSGYPGGYDVRAVGYQDWSKNGSLVVSAINHSNQPTTLDVNFAPFQNATKVAKHYHVSGDAGVDATTIERNFTLETNPTPTTKTFNSTGSLTVTLPPSSVSTITFE